MIKSFRLLIVLTLFSVLLTSCGEKYPSARLGDLEFHITDVQVRDAQPGYSDITIELVAENTGKNHVAFPENSEDRVEGYAFIEGKIGTETYYYGDSLDEVQAQPLVYLNSLPPHFRSRDTLHFVVAKTATNLKLIITLHKRHAFGTDIIAKDTMEIVLTGEYPVIEIPVESGLLFSSLGNSTKWCPNAKLSVQGLQSVYFKVEGTDITVMGLILDVTFFNNAGETLSPICRGMTATLFTSSGMIFHNSTSRSIWYSTNLDTPPGYSARGKLLLTFERVSSIDIDLNNSWLSLRRYTATPLLLGGYKITDDKQIIYEIPSISNLPFQDFSPEDYGTNFIQSYQPVSP